MMPFFFTMPISMNMPTYAYSEAASLKHPQGQADRRPAPSAASTAPSGDAGSSHRGMARITYMTKTARIIRPGQVADGLSRNSSASPCSVARRLEGNDLGGGRSFDDLGRVADGDAGDQV